MSRWNSIAAVVVVFFVGIFLALWNRGIRIREENIETWVVARKTLTETVSSSGKTKAKKEATLKFQTAGRLLWVGVSVGDHVAAGQGLAGLDTRELQKNLIKALRDYSKERNDFEQDRLTTYKDTVFTDTIKRILEKNQWDLDKAVVDVELKTIALQFATLTSPIDGIVTRLDTPVAGINVTTTDTIVVADPNSLVFVASVDETDIGKIHVGQQAKIILDAFDDNTFMGQINVISFTAETSSAGATVFPVEIVLSDATNLRSGLNGDMTISPQEVSGALFVPSSAVRETENETYVIEKTENTWKKTTVQTGLTTGIDIEIRSGLSEGSVVVVKGSQYLPKEFANGK